VNLCASAKLRRTSNVHSILENCRRKLVTLEMCIFTCVSHLTVTKPNCKTVLFINVFLQAVVDATEHVDGVTRKDAESTCEAGVCNTDEEEIRRWKPMLYVSTAV